MKNTKIQAVTLVEMIVVITILAVLWVIGLVAYSTYIPSVRDASRLATLWELVVWMESYKVKKQLPFPDNSIEIKSSGSVISYQWELWINPLTTLRYWSTGEDPETGRYYDYYLSKNGNYFQLITYFEKDRVENYYEDVWFLNKAVAAESNKEIDYDQRFIKVFGDNLWFLTDENNKPVNRRSDFFSNGFIDLATTTETFTAHFTNKLKKQGNKQLIGNLSTMAKSQAFWSPSSCLPWYIPVVWNEKLFQPGFCAAKYEMTLANGDGNPDSTSWNTYKYNNGDYIASKKDYPLTDLTITQANNACKGLGMHLITNSEYTTLARDIESEKINWSGNQIGVGNLYSWNSSNSTHGISNSTGPRSNATKTGWKDNPNMSYNRVGDERRQLMLSNDEIIWDLVGNVHELVNKSNDIENSDSNNGEIINILNGSTARNWDHWDIPEWIREEYWPLMITNSISGFWQIDEYSSSSDDDVLLRGGSYGWSSTTGLYTLLKTVDSNYDWDNTGFRCAY